MKHITLIGLVLLLVGCGETPEERSRRHNEQCLSYGATLKSPEYIQCRATLAKNQEIEDKANSDATSAMAAGMAAGSIAGAARIR